MNYQTLSSVVMRVFTVGAFALIALAVAELMANMSGYTLLHQAHSPGRLIDLGAALAVIVITLLLRQIRDEFRKKQA